MKKNEMIKNLEDKGIDVPDLKWKEFQIYYKEKMETEQPEPEPVIDTRTKLQKDRDELFPQIVDLMKQLKGKTNATREELDEMFRLYNRFYLRNDKPTCGTCVSRVWQTFKKITKGRA